MNAEEKGECQVMSYMHYMTDLVFFLIGTLPKATTGSVFLCFSTPLKPGLKYEKTLDLTSNDGST